VRRCYYAIVGCKISRRRWRRVADADGAVQHQCSSSLRRSQLHVADVLRPLRIHAVRTVSTGTQMSRYVTVTVLLACLSKTLRQILPISFSPVYKTVQYDSLCSAMIPMKCLMAETLQIHTYIRTYVIKVIVPSHIHKQSACALRRSTHLTK